MRFTAQYPLDDVAGASDWCRPGAIAEYARVAESTGFSAVAFTEHPAPTGEWLAGGGHAALDPFVALTHCAAHTTTIRLITFLAIAPYRNPFLLAKAAASVDVLSNGRLTLGLGAGYLAGEFQAIGVERDDRAALLEEAVRILPQIWTGNPVTSKQRNLDAVDITCAPPSLQQPIPIWVGGNSRRSRQLAGQAAGGWTPLLVDAPGAARAGTVRLPDVDRLRSSIVEVQQFAASAGRDPASLEVQIKAPASRIIPDFDGAELIESLYALAEAGVAWFVVHPVAASSAEAVRTIERFARQVISPIRASMSDENSLTS